MHRVNWLMCFLVLGTLFVPAIARLTDRKQKRLEGTWTATAAERDGSPAEDVVGHRLSVDGDRFRIESKSGERLFAGTVRLDPKATPAAIDFTLTEGAAGTRWKGIYSLDGTTLRVCDNAPNPDAARPTAFEAKSGSGYVLITFERSSR